MSDDAVTDTETPDSHAPDDGTPDTEPASDARLDQLQDDIDRARQHAEDADVLIDPDEPRFHDSGEEHPELDDQAITPPG